MRSQLYVIYFLMVRYNGAWFPGYRGAKRKLAPVEDSVDADAAEDSHKTEVKAAETKRSKRQTAVADKPKVCL